MTIADEAEQATARANALESASQALLNRAETAEAAYAAEHHALSSAAASLTRAEADAADARAAANAAWAEAASALAATAAAEADARNAREEARVALASAAEDAAKLGAALFRAEEAEALLRAARAELDVLRAERAEWGAGGGQEGGGVGGSGWGPLGLRNNDGGSNISSSGGAAPVRSANQRVIVWMHGDAGQGAADGGRVGAAVVLRAHDDDALLVALDGGAERVFAADEIARDAVGTGTGEGDGGGGGEEGDDSLVPPKIADCAAAAAERVGGGGGRAPPRRSPPVLRGACAVASCGLRVRSALPCPLYGRE